MKHHIPTLYRFILIIAGFSISLSVVTLPVEASPDFDPASVQSSQCSGGGFQCGYNPPTKQQDEAVPLSDATMISHRGLPARSDISNDMPPVINQGQQNSCVAFSVGYYTRSYLEKKGRGWQYDAPTSGGKGQHVFSPAFIYNQINGGQDNGSYFEHALSLVIDKGAATWNIMPYSEKDYRTQPTAAIRSAALSYKASNYKRIPFNDLNALKSELSSGRPVIFGITIDDNFYKLKNQVYDQTGGRTYGGHAMTLVGYDDSKKSPKGDVGAFKIINSWGTSWGDKGYGWISYRQWVAMSPYSYVLYPMAGTDTTPAVQQEVTQVVEGNIQPPARIEASQGSFQDRIDVSWSAVSGALVYAVTRAEPGQDTFGFLAYSNTTQFSDLKVQKGATYRYRVIAMNDLKASSSQDAPIASGYAADGTAATKPGIVTDVKLSLQANGSQVVATWNQAPGATYYQIRRWNGATNTWQVWTQRITTNSFTDGAPKRDSENRYSVRAGNQSGVGDWSDVALISIPGNSTPPNAPASLVVSNGTFKEKIQLRWNASAGATGYDIYRYSYSSKKWEGPISRVSQNSFDDSSKTVQNGQYYAYTVLAVNQSGLSGYAEPAVGRANPLAHRAGEKLDPPAGIEATVDANGMVTVSWQSVKDADEYYILRKKKDSKDYTFAGSTDAKTLKFVEKFAGKPGDLFLYTVRSKPMMGSESADGRAAAVFINAEKPQVSHRFMPGQGLERMTGVWQGRHWDGKTAPREFSLTIDGQMGEISLQLSDNTGAKTSVSGNYPVMADTVQLKGVTLEFDEKLNTVILRGGENGLPVLGDRTVSFTR